MADITYTYIEVCYHDEQHYLVQSFSVKIPELNTFQITFQLSSLFSPYKPKDHFCPETNCSISKPSEGPVSTCEPFSVTMAYMDINIGFSYEWSLYAFVESVTNLMIYYFNQFLFFSVRKTIMSFDCNNNNNRKCLKTSQLYCKESTSG